MLSGAKSEAKQEEEEAGEVGMGERSNTNTVYHERQRLQFCLLHALNNLMQKKESFTRAELDGIADNLVLNDPNKDQWTPLSLIFKPHHNIFTGNYDVNVLIAALEARKKKVVWHDRRKGASSIDLGAETLVGLMINVPVRRLRGFWTGRHWVAIRNIDGIWFNLDSDLSAPKQFQDKEKVISLPRQHTQSRWRTHDCAARRTIELRISDSYRSSIFSEIRPIPVSMMRLQTFTVAISLELERCYHRFIYLEGSIC